MPERRLSGGIKTVINTGCPYRQIRAVSSGPGKGGGRFLGPGSGLVPTWREGPRVGGRPITVAVAGGVHCGACAGAAGRNSDERSAALRWSALTRPVARASGATVERATLHGLPAPYEFAIAPPPTASHVSQVVNANACVHACPLPNVRTKLSILDGRFVEGEEIRREAEQS